jgi:hypothetical protein
MDGGSSAVAFRRVRFRFDLSVLTGYSAAHESERWIGPGHQRSED